MSKFVVDSASNKGLFGFFEDDGETGYFYLYEPDGVGIVDHLHIYSNSKELKFRKKDVSVVWSSEYDKCGVKILGRFYGIFDIFRNQKISKSITNRDAPSIMDPTLLAGFH